MSMQPCPKGCIRLVTRYQSGALSFHGPGASGSRQQQGAQAVLVPIEMRVDYAEMSVLAAFAANPPGLEFYDDLHGVGGMFVPADWVILVGVGDMRASQAMS